MLNTLPVWVATTACDSSRRTAPTSSRSSARMAPSWRSTRLDCRSTGACTRPISSGATSGRRGSARGAAAVAVGEDCNSAGDASCASRRTATRLSSGRSACSESASPTCATRLRRSMRSIAASPCKNAGIFTCAEAGTCASTRTLRVVSSARSSTLFSAFWSAALAKDLRLPWRDGSRASARAFAACPPLSRGAQRSNRAGSAPASSGAQSSRGAVL